MYERQAYIMIFGVTSTAASTKAIARSQWVKSQSKCKCLAARHVSISDNANTTATLHSDAYARSKAPPRRFEKEKKKNKGINKNSPADETNKQKSHLEIYHRAFSRLTGQQVVLRRLGSFEVFEQRVA